MLLTNYKHTQPTLGLSVTFVFNIEYIHTYIYTHIHIHTYIRFVSVWPTVIDRLSFGILLFRYTG